MKNTLTKSLLDKIVSNTISKKHIYGAVFYVSSKNDIIDLISSVGNMSEESIYYVASINKYFISSIVLKLYKENRLDLSDKISKYLSAEIVRNIHTYQGKDYSNELTIAHLISLTSGLPCYLTDILANGKIAMHDLETGIDQAWPIEKVINAIKQIDSHFPPGKDGSAKYGDTNHQILSMIVENIIGMPINIVLKNLFNELNLSNTFVIEDDTINYFIPLRYKSEIINLPLFLKSTRNEIISTARDQMTFLKAFFDGYFYPKEKLKELETWNKIFFPFSYGIGIQKFFIPRFLSPFQKASQMLGHCGSVGSVAFYVPDADIYITGTINQQSSPNIAFQTLIKIIKSFT